MCRPIQGRIVDEERQTIDLVEAAAMDEERRAINSVVEVATIFRLI